MKSTLSHPASAVADDFPATFAQDLGYKILTGNTQYQFTKLSVLRHHLQCVIAVF